VTLNAAAANPEGNLDIALSLYNGSGTLVATANPAELAANLSTTVAAGTYYIAVEGVGKGTAATGYTDYGSIGQFVLNANTPGSANLPPVAVISSNVTSGTAPVAVSFSSAGSSDPEGTTLRYDWDFGDGTTSTLANPSKTYNVAGTYVASLVVYDASGLSAAASRTITVTAPVVAPHHYVSSMTATKQTGLKGTRAQVVVTMKDQNGAVKSNVKVSGKWSGLTNSTTVTGTTNTSGKVTFSSAYTKLAGTFTFTVTGATATGSTYNASKNTQSSISIVK
jgi:PKD repeat protein